MRYAVLVERSIRLQCACAPICLGALLPDLRLTKTDLIRQAIRMHLAVLRKMERQFRSRKPTPSTSSPRSHSAQTRSGPAVGRLANNSHISATADSPAAV